MFHVGQDVVCIRDDWGFSPKGLKILPKKGEVYKVAGIREPGFFALHKVPHLNLIGWDNHNKFASNFFRPVLKTDISVFTAMLKQKELSGGLK